MEKTTKPSVPPPRGPEPKTYKVIIEVDRITRDEPDMDVVEGVTMVEVTHNGDLLLYRKSKFPVAGYSAGVWMTFDTDERRKSNGRNENNS